MKSLYLYILLIPVFAYSQIPSESSYESSMSDHGFEFIFRAQNTTTPVTHPNIISESPDGIIFKSRDSDSSEIFYAVVRYYNREKEEFGFVFTPNNQLMVVNKHKEITQINGYHEFFNLGDTISDFQYMQITEITDRIDKYVPGNLVLFLINNLYFIGTLGMPDSPFHWKILFPNNSNDRNSDVFFIRINKETKIIDETNYSYFNAMKVQAMGITDRLEGNTLPSYWD